MISGYKEVKSYNYKKIRDTDQYGESWWEMLVIRPLVYKLTGLFANYTNFTPNQITIMSLLFGLISAYSFLQGTKAYLIIGALLYETSFILDCIDGRIARLKNLKSAFGAYLDIMSDFMKYSLIIISLTYGSYVLTKDISVFIYGYMYLVLEFICMTQTYIIGNHAKNKKNAEDNTYIMKERFPFLADLKTRIDPEDRLTYLPFTSIEAETIAFLIFPILVNIKLGLIIGSIILFADILILTFYNFVINKKMI